MPCAVTSGLVSLPISVFAPVAMTTAAHRATGTGATEELRLTELRAVCAQALTAADSLVARARIFVRALVAPGLREHAKACVHAERPVAGVAHKPAELPDGQERRMDDGRGANLFNATVPVSWRIHE